MDLAVTSFAAVEIMVSVMHQWGASAMRAGQELTVTQVRKRIYVDGFSFQSAITIWFSFISFGYHHL